MHVRHVTTSKTLDSDSNSSRHFHPNQPQEDNLLPMMPKACILAETYAPSGPHISNVESNERFANQHQTGSQ